MKTIDKIKNACVGQWRTLGGISRETKISKKLVALTVFENPMEFVINYNSPTNAATLIKRSY